MTIHINEYLDEYQDSPFAKWFNSLNAEASAKITTALYRLGLGNTSNVKSVKSGVYELKIHFGPGYRVYFGKVGEHIVLLLGGGTKKGQDKDIATAKERWAKHKKRLH